MNKRKQLGQTFTPKSDTEVITITGETWDTAMLLDGVITTIKKTGSPYDRQPSTGSHIRGTICKNINDCKITYEQGDQTIKMIIW